MSPALTLDDLEPVSEGLAACPALWEPLLDAARIRPVRLIGTAAYDVWLVAHPCVPHRVATRRGGNHVITPVHGDLAVRSPGAALPRRIVDAGSTVAAPAGDDVEVASFLEPVAFAIHVHSPASPVDVPSVALN